MRGITGKLVWLFLVMMLVAIQAFMFWPTANKVVKGDYSGHFIGQDVQVVVYGKDSCSFCQKTKAYLDEHKVKYAFIEITTNEKGFNEYKKFDVNSVPVIVFRNQRILGFDKDLLDQQFALLR